MQRKTPPTYKNLVSVRCSSYKIKCNHIIIVSERLMLCKLSHWLTDWLMAPFHSLTNHGADSFSVLWVPQLTSSVIRKDHLSLTHIHYQLNSFDSVCMCVWDRYTVTSVSMVVQLPVCVCVAFRGSLQINLHALVCLCVSASQSADSEVSGQRHSWLNTFFSFSLLTSFNSIFFSSLLSPLPLIFVLLMSLFTRFLSLPFFLVGHIFHPDPPAEIS